VRSAEDVETLRRLRNECRKFMTGSTKVITKAQQAKWWAADARRAYLFVEAGKPVGFAYLRREGGVNWITCGLTKAARGKGYGTLIYYTFKPCAARIRTDNQASIRACEKAGYRRVMGELNEKDVEKLVSKGVETVVYAS
jgi:RimJ/RimL family protein N-acetyltransferase